MLETCTICGAIFDPAVADHYAWHERVDPPLETTPEPEPETPEEAPDGNVGT